VASSPKGSAAQVGRGEGGDGAVLGGLDTADGQAGGDEGGGEQRGDDRQQHRGPDAERGDQAEREQRAADRTEVVHRSFEAVGPAVGAAGTRSASRALRAGTRRPRAVQAPARSTPTCQTLPAAPVSAARAAVRV